MSKSDSQNKDCFKAKPTTSPAELLKNLNLIFDQLRDLEASRDRNPYVEKYIRVFVDTSYHGTKKCVEKICTLHPEIREKPADTNDPREYLRNVHTWCVGQLFWENGERIGGTPSETGMSTTDKEPSKELDKVEAGTQRYPGPRRQVPTSDADRQRASIDGYTVGDWKPDTDQYIVPGKEPAEKADKQDKATTTSKPDSIIGDTWSILGIPINVKKLRTKLKSHPILLICCLSLIVIIATYPLWHPLINKTNHGSTASANIFADVSKDGTILRSNNFPWKIQKAVDQDGNILYTMVDRRGDATAISVVPDNPKYTVYQSYGGMVIKYTCAEEKISDFTIKVKY